MDSETSRVNANSLASIYSGEGSVKRKCCMRLDSQLCFVFENDVRFAVTPSLDWSSEDDFWYRH